MNVYLATVGKNLSDLRRAARFNTINFGDTAILDSFFYVQNKTMNMEYLLPRCRSFMLDSGAFTFLKGKKEAVDWDAYLNKYANFINRLNIKLFFELDIDSIVGIERVEQMRDRLESLTGKKPIPVWHKNRGKQYFIDMCQAYPYVALGGIAIKEFPLRKFERFFPWFIYQAHKCGTKIHGLGYTSIQGLRKYHFDSVDSSSWITSTKVGQATVFIPSQGGMSTATPPVNKKMRTYECEAHNLCEWMKFSSYAKVNL